LPYGKRVGVAAVDRLTIVSHDNFQAIVDEAKKPDSVIRVGVVIGRDIPIERSKVVTIEPALVQRLVGTTDSAGKPGSISGEGDLFETAEQKTVAKATLDVIREEFETLRKSADLTMPDVQKQVIARVVERLTPIQPELFKAIELSVVADVVKKTIEVRNELSIDIPRIVVVPKGTVRCGYRDFAMDCTGIRLQPVSQEILIQHLHDWEQHKLRRGDAVVVESRIEDYLVRGLIDSDDIDYDTHAALLYKLAGQVVTHLRSYLADEDEVLNVLQAHQQSLVQTIYTQMQAHFEESATEYDVQVSRGFTTLRPASYSVSQAERPRDFRLPIEEKLLIRGMLFGRFRRALYPAVKFQSDTERRLSVVLENDKTVLKWFKPAKGDFRIYYTHDEEYVPDFAVETADACYLLEPKARNELTDPVVQAKARAAALWCDRATTHAGGKPWRYVLIPHDVVDETKTLAGLAAGHTVGVS